MATGCLVKNREKWGGGSVYHGAGEKVKGEGKV
jgi:hypothetical protein